jgi:serine/threonine protein kinase
MMDLHKPGHRIGPYELLAPIGAGGMGEVWKARDTRLDRTVALKFSQAAFTSRFQHEARAIAALNHPNIATLHDVGDNFLVMEFIDGEPIKPPNDTRKLLDIAVQIADGLAAAHAAGIVHRDLKPANILLTKSSRVKILDFGLAKQTTTTEDATQTINAIAGTAAYMSPEQARGDTLDTRSDQFSFGLVLYELATATRAFQKASMPETLAAILRDDPAPLPSALPAPLRWLIERCLSKDPENRYDSTADLFRDLKNIRDRLTEVTTPLARTSHKPSIRSKDRERCKRIGA